MVRDGGRSQRKPCRARSRGASEKAAHDRRAPGPARDPRRCAGAPPCSNNYLGLADHPRVRRAAADAAERYGAGAGASRLISGDMELHRRLEVKPRGVQGHRVGASLRLGLPGEHRHRVRARPATAAWSSRTSSTTRASSTAAGSRGPRRSSTATGTLEHLAWGLEQAAGRARDRSSPTASFRWTATSRPCPRWPSSRAATARGSWWTRPTARARSARAAEAPSPRPGSRASSTWSWGPSARRSAATAPTRARARQLREFLINRARPVHLLDRAASPLRRRRAWPRSPCSSPAPAWSSTCAGTPR